MAAKKRQKQKKTSPWRQILYVGTVAALVVLLVLMYRNWQEKNKRYDDLVRQAAATEGDYDIRARKLLWDTEYADPEASPLPGER